MNDNLATGTNSSVESPVNLNGSETLYDQRDHVRRVNEQLKALCMPRALHTFVHRRVSVVAEVAEVAGSSLPEFSEWIRDLKTHGKLNEENIFSLGSLANMKLLLVTTKFHKH